MRENGDGGEMPLLSFAQGDLADVPSSLPCCLGDFSARPPTLSPKSPHPSPYHRLMPMGRTCLLYRLTRPVLVKLSPRQLLPCQSCSLIAARPAPPAVSSCRSCTPALLSCPSSPSASIAPDGLTPEGNEQHHPGSEVHQAGWPSLFCPLAAMPAGTSREQISPSPISPHPS